MSDTTDLIARLRQMADGLHDDMSTGAEAADALEQQAAQIEALRAQVKQADERGDEALRRAHAGEAEVEALRAALQLARNEIAALPTSLGYAYTSLPQIDAALRQEQPT